MLPQNDDSCGWLETLPKRTPEPPLKQNIQCDWLILGAGYTGLSAARKLAELKPNDSIVIIDAQKAGEGASSRNSGYLVDSTLNDGHLSDSGMENYLSKYRLNSLGVEAVRSYVDQHQVDCDWNECGKFHATSMQQNEEKLQRFNETLNLCGIGNRLLQGNELSQRLGTSFYRMAVHTEGGVMLQPAKLALSMIETLPSNVTLYEQTPVINWNHSAIQVKATTPTGVISAKSMLVCSNGFMRSLGIQKSRAFPLTLTASLTRVLTDEEFASIGAPEEWGVLSAQAMGATVRLTSDRRIMIRNTAEAWWPVNMSTGHLKQRKIIHEQGLQVRFPDLPLDLIEHTWSGVTCISGNNGNLFKSLASNLFLAGCYNGGGIGLATLFGEQLALKATGGDSDAIRAIEERPKPNWLPPQPFLHLGVKTRLMKDRFFARAER